MESGLVPGSGRKHCGDKIPNLIHGVVILLAEPIFRGVFFPAVLDKFPEGIPASSGKPQFAAAQQLADLANAIQDLVFGRKDGVDAVTTNTFHKAGS